MAGKALLDHLQALAGRYGLTVWQRLPGQVGHHAPGSLHYMTFPGTNSGRAFDAYGPAWRMRAYAWHLRVFYKTRLAEGIYSGAQRGRNLSVKHGRNVPASYWGDATWSGHANHVHVAA